MVYDGEPMEELWQPAVVVDMGKKPMPIFIDVKEGGSDNYSLRPDTPGKPGNILAEAYAG